MVDVYLRCKICRSVSLLLRYIKLIHYIGSVRSLEFLLLLFFFFIADLVNNYNNIVTTSGVSAMVS